MEVEEPESTSHGEELNANQIHLLDQAAQTQQNRDVYRQIF